MTRVYKVTGENWIGVEIKRDGDQITLRGGPQHWPFPLERTLLRTALTYMHGDHEPDVEPEREFPIEEEGRPKDATDDLFPESTPTKPESKQGGS